MMFPFKPPFIGGFSMAVFNNQRVTWFFVVPQNLVRKQTVCWRHTFFFYIIPFFNLWHALLVLNMNKIVGQRPNGESQAICWISLFSSPAGFISSRGHVWSDHEVIQCRVYLCTRFFEPIVQSTSLWSKLDQTFQQLRSLRLPQELEPLKKNNQWKPHIYPLVS